MIHNAIFDYVLTMFYLSRHGDLLVGNEESPLDVTVDWDREMADELAQQCSDLVFHLTELSRQYDKLKMDTRQLTQQQLEIWNTYLKPFPPHGLDMDALELIWEKFEHNESVTEEEWELADRYIRWFEENAMTRLPIKRCDPIPLINRAKGYCKLVRIHAPEILQEKAAKRFAEEFVLYHCLQESAAN